MTQIERWQRISLVVGIVGSILAILAFSFEPDPSLRSYLFAYVYWISMGLGCLGILLLHHTVGGMWGVPIRRMCEAGARTLPYMLLLVIPLLFSLSKLYPWARPEAAQDPVIRAKAAYLNVPFFVARTVAYFAVWSLYAWRLSSWSAKQDLRGDPEITSKMRAISAPGLVVFVLITSFAFIDWVMSLEPDWFSTIYGLIFIMGQVLESFAFVIILVIVLSKAEPMKRCVTAQHLHDLGNLMFAFMVLWAYVSFSQFLIIWSGNLPDETSWYLSRLQGGWGWVALSLVVFHFATPFVLLLMRKTKRRADRLLKVCLLMLAARLVDVYWVVIPSFYKQTMQIHWTSWIMLFAVGGLWLTMFFSQLRSRPLLPLNDPRVFEAPRETVAF